MDISVQRQSRKNTPSFVGLIDVTQCRGVVIQYISTNRSKKSPSLRISNAGCPKEHLIPTLVQNPQAIGVLRHIQSVEERPGFNFCALQIRRDVRNAIEHGVSIVLFSNAEELNGEHHLSASIYFRNGLRLVCVNCVRAQSGENFSCSNIVIACQPKEVTSVRRADEKAR